MAGALCNNDKMRLGLFAPNISQACAATTAEGHLELTRAHGRSPTGSSHCHAPRCDGVVLSRVNHSGMRKWPRPVLLLTEEAGLREPFRPVQ